MPNNQEIFKGLQKLVEMSASQTPEQKKGFAAEVYAKRYRNFFTLPLFFAVIIFFLYLGATHRDRFSTANWYILVALCSIFLLLGFFVWLSYAWVIIKSLRDRKK